MLGPRLAVLLVILSPAMIYGDTSPHEIMLSTVLPGSSEVEWRSIDPLVFPEEFRDEHPLAKNRLIALGFEAGERDDFKVFVEVEMPYLDGFGRFCRSRVSTYYFCNYVLGASYSDQMRMSVVDHGEFVSFRSHHVDDSCKTASYSDLSDYLFVDGRHDDDVLVAVNKAIQPITAAEDRVLSIGVSRTGAAGNSNIYYAHIRRIDGGTVTVKLRNSATVSFTLDEAKPYD